MKTSIALCTLNGEQYLLDQLQSIENQETLPDELIIVDDQSNDATANIVERFASHASFPVIFSTNKNRVGIAQNFVLSASKCSGDVIFFCDQDDRWVRSKIRRFLDLFTDHPKIELIHSNARLVNQVGSAIGKNLFDVLNPPREYFHKDKFGSAPRAFDELLRRNLVTGATLAVKANFFRKSIPFGQQWLHDEWLGMLAASQDKLAVIDECLIEYRQHANNAIGAQGRTLSDYAALILESQSEEYMRAVDKYSALMQFCQSQSNDLNPTRLALIEQKLNFFKSRNLYSKKRLARTLPIAKHILSGKYSLFTPGLKSAALDQFTRR